MEVTKGKILQRFPLIQVLSRDEGQVIREGSPIQLVLWGNGTQPNVEEQYVRVLLKTFADDAGKAFMKALGQNLFADISANEVSGLQGK